MVTQTLGTAQFREGITRDVLNRKERALERTQKRNQALQTIRNTAEAAKLKREQDLEDQKAEREFKVGMTLLEDRLDKARREGDTLEAQKIRAEIDSLIALTDQRRAMAKKTKTEARQQITGEPKDYRQWFTTGTKEAMKRVLINQPEKESEIAILFKALEAGDDAAAAASEQRLTRAMTPEQYEEYQTNIDQFFKESPGVPKHIRDYYTKNVLEKPKEEEDTIIAQLPNAAEFKDQIATDQDTGNRYISDGTEWKRM